MIFGRKHVVACRCESGPGAVLRDLEELGPVRPVLVQLSNSPPTAGRIEPGCTLRLRAPRHQSGVLGGLHRINLYELTGARSVMVYVGLPFA